MSLVDKGFHFSSEGSGYYDLLIFQKDAFTNALHKKMKFFIKDFFNKCDQIRSFQWSWSHLLKKSLMENFIFCGVM